jgi:hypothetical protein
MLDEIINYVQSLQNQVEVMIIDVKWGDYCVLFCNYNYDNLLLLFMIVMHGC